MLMRVMMPLLCLIAVLAGFLYGRPWMIGVAFIVCVLSVGCSFADRLGIFHHKDCPRCQEPLVFYRPRLGQIYCCVVCQTEFSPLGWQEQMSGPNPAMNGKKTDGVEENQESESDIIPPESS